MKVDLNEFVSGQKYDDIKKFNLNNGFKDPSFLREKITLDFMHERGIAAPRCSYAAVSINGIARGLYTLVEEVNNDFCDQRFGSSSGNRFKGDPSGDLRWYGSIDTSYFHRYELDNNSSTNNWSDLIRLTDKINNSTAVQFHDSLDAVINTGSFIQHWAIDNLFANLDAYIGSGHNYYIYHESVSGKFEWIHWDVNESFGNFQQGQSLTQIKNLPWNYISNPNSRPLCNKMLGDTFFHSAVETAICQMNTFFTNQIMDPVIDSIVNSIRPYVYADTLKTFTNQQFDDNVNGDISINSPNGTQWIGGIKSFINARHSSLNTQLAFPGNCLVSTDVQATQDAAGIELYPNPVHDQLSITVPEHLISSASTVYLTDLTGRIIFSKLINGPLSTIDCRELSSGIYVVKIHSGQGQITKRVCISN